MNIKYFLIPVVIFSVLMMTNVADAQITILGSDPIQCDPAAPVKGIGSKGLPGCGLDDFILVIRIVIEFMLKIIFPIGAVMIVWGGITIMTAAGSESRVTKGKEIITWAVIGIAIALASYLIIALLNNIISDSSYKFEGEGFEINTNN